MNSLIQLESIGKKFTVGNGGVVALSHISVQVQKGEFISILGPSGSGKSTLLHILGLLSMPTQGRIYFEGLDVLSLREKKLSSLRSQKIGFVFQSFHLLNVISALENVELPLIYQRTPFSERKTRAMEALEAVGMTHRASHFPRQLSGGESQRVAIARALVSRPAVIMADEPTGNLDTQTGYEILQILKGFNARGVTLMIVTHDQQIANQAHRRIHLKDGELLKCS